jgi:hypothetical protein
MRKGFEGEGIKHPYREKNVAGCHDPRRGVNSGTCGMMQDEEETYERGKITPHDPPPTRHSRGTIFVEHTIMPAIITTEQSKENQNLTQY